MKRTTALYTTFLLAVASGPVHANSTVTMVTPANIKEQNNPPLEVRVHETEDTKRFEVLVKGKAGDEERFLQDPYLKLKRNNRQVVVCPVAKSEQKKDVVFTFWVAADLLDGATFEVAWIAHIREKDRQGKERWVGMPSANLLTFPLKDFAESAPAVDKPEDQVRALMKDLDSKDARTRRMAVNALRGHGAAAAPALPKLRALVKQAHVRPEELTRDYPSVEDVPEPVLIHWAIRHIESASKPSKK